MKECIERDAVIEWVESWLNLDRYYRPNGKHNNIPITELYALLKRIPAADVAPVKHGEWVDGKRMCLDGTFYWFRECSLCGYEREDDNEEKDTNYCPNCGAKMDGGADE